MKPVGQKYVFSGRTHPFAHLKQRALLMVVILLLSGVVVPGIRAQEDAETLEVVDAAGTLIVAYPEGWAAETQEVDYTYATLSNLPLVTTDEPSVMVEIVILPIDRLAIPVDLQAENRAVSYFEQYQLSELVGEKAVFGAILPVQFGAGDDTFDGAMMAFLQPGNLLPIVADTKVSLAVAIELTEDRLGFMEFMAGEAIAGQILPTWLDMLDSLTWNGATLGNELVRQQALNLESGIALRQQYVELYEAQAPSPQSIMGLDSRSEFSLASGKTTVSFPRPQGWYPTQVSENVVQFESHFFPNSVIRFRWLPQETGELTPDALLEQALADEPDAELVDSTIFEWSDYQGVGVSYRLPDDQQVAMRLKILLPEGVMEISAAGPPQDWVNLELVFLAMNSGLKIGEITLDFAELIQASNALLNPDS